MAEDFQQIFETNVNLDSLVQGNNGSVRRFFVRRAGAIVPLDGAVVEVAIKKGDSLLTKQAVITDAANGICEIKLTRGELATSGLYFIQPTVKFADDDEFSGDIESFKVKEKLTGSIQAPGDGSFTVKVDGGEF